MLLAPLGNIIAGWAGRAGDRQVMELVDCKGVTLCCTYPSQIGCKLWGFPSLCPIATPLPPANSFCYNMAGTRVSPGPCSGVSPTTQGTWDGP